MGVVQWWEVISAVIAGDGTKQLFPCLDICSVLLKTPSVHIQPQNVETWLSLKSIFNSRPSPSLAPTTAHDWPFTLAMFRPCFCFGPACREETVGWMLSHPHTDLWATMFQGLFLDLQSLENFLLMNSVHIVKSNPLPTHTLHILSRPALLTIVLTHKHKHWHWAVSQSTSAHTV